MRWPAATGCGLEVKRRQAMEKEMNKFEQVIVTAVRARQLAEGVEVKPGQEGRKITTVALEELERGELKFEAKGEPVE